MGASSVPAAAVFVKAVPVGGAFLRPVPDGLSRDGISHGLDPVNELTVAWAVAQRDTGHLGRLVAITMGPEAADDAVRRAVALGCDEALRLGDASLAGADVGTTARVLAAAVTRVGARLALFGCESLDGSSGAVPAAVAARLGWPVVSFARIAMIGGDILRARRDLGTGDEEVEVELPAVVSLVGGAEVAYPTLRAVLAARQRPVEVLGLAHLGLAPPPAAPGERVVGLRAVPVARAETQVVTAEDGAAAIVRLLDERGVLGA